MDTETETSYCIVFMKTGRNSDLRRLSDADTDRSLYLKRDYDKSPFKCVVLEHSRQNLDV